MSALLMHSFLTNEWRSITTMSRFSLNYLSPRQGSRYTICIVLVVCALIIAGNLSYVLRGSGAHAQPVQAGFNHFLSTHYNGDGQYDDNSPGSGSAQELYDNLAYPNTAVAYDQVVGAYNAYRTLLKRS